MLIPEMVKLLVSLRYRHGTPAILSNNKGREWKSKGKLMLIPHAPVAMNTPLRVAQKINSPKFVVRWNLSNSALGSESRYAIKLLHLGDRWKFHVNIMEPRPEDGTHKTNDM